MNYKIGIGYDIHRFAPKRKLILGGVNVPYKAGLLGHSDADVVLHAISDAILGACRAGDIGEHFPDSDKKYKNISSLKLLSAVGGILKKKFFKIGNIDVMLLLEKPKIASYKKQMETKIADVLGLNKNLVSIKATTHEGIGAIGKGQAAAAYAVVLIQKI